MTKVFYLSADEKHIIIPLDPKYRGGDVILNEEDLSDMLYVIQNPDKLFKKKEASVNA